VTTTRTLRRVVLEETTTLFTLPSYPHSWLPPRPPEFLELLLHLRLAVRLGIARIAGWPLAEFSGLTCTPCTPHMLTIFAHGCGSRNKDLLAHVARASDTLPRWLVDEFITGPGSDGEHSLPLGLLRILPVCLLLFGRLLSRVAWTLLAALVLALPTYFVCAVEGPAPMAAAVDTHTDSLLDTFDGRLGCWRCDPFVRLEGESVLCKQGTSSFLLHSIAVHIPSCRSRWGRWAGSNGAVVVSMHVRQEWTWVATHVTGITCGFVVSCFAASSMGLGASCLSALEVEDGSGTDTGALLLDLSLLKTVLILFTYFPSVPRSTFLPLSGRLPSSGVVMVGAAKRRTRDLGCNTARGTAEL